MAASALTGPLIVYGSLGNMPAAFAGPLPDPQTDVGPSAFYKGTAILDPRFIYPKDQVTGYAAKVGTHFMEPTLRSVGAVPAALASNNIAAAANANNGVPMTLVTTSSVGVAVQMPYRPFSMVYNAAAVATAAVCLDFGFAFGNCTTSSGTVTVSDNSIFEIGMPLVIDAVGNAGGTIPLLTQVTAISTTAQTITVSPVPLATNAAAAIGTGDNWGPVESSANAYPLPTAHQPQFKGGSIALLDSRQSLMRGVQITGVSGGAGGNFLVSGADTYGMPLTQLITVAAGASTGWSLKTFKYVLSVTPQFTDAHNYSVGTSDVFGFAYRSVIWDDTTITWAGVPQPSTVGWLAGVGTSPSTNLLGDVRGTLQAGTNGGGTGISGGAASNGVVTTLVMTGRRITIEQVVPAWQMILASQANAAWLMGVTQA